MHFGERLRRERLRRHLSQEDVAEALGTSVKSIGRWEQGRATPQPNTRLQLSRFFGLSPEDLFADLEAQVSAVSLWTVPFPRNPCFTGREAILQKLHERLAVSQSIALTQASALSGLGGIGKTQIALEYAYRYAQEYQAVFWLAAETTESLLASLQHIADQTELPERQATKQAEMVAAVQHWLATHENWLLIADNVEDLDQLQRILPPRRRGSLLLTSRRRALGTLAESLEISPMSNEEGVTLVLHRVRRSSPVAPLSPSSSELSPVPTPAEAVELVTLLEGLPLALDQAGAYIEETGCSIADYVQRYRNQRQQILARRGIHGGAHPASVATTLRLSVEQAEREHPAAANLLRLCAFLHPEAIPEEILQIGAPYLETVLGPATTDPFQFDLALAALRGASLVTRQAETRTLSVHRLVQAVLQDQMESDELRAWSERIVRVVNAAFPEPQFSAWPQCERYLTHALACVPWIEEVAGDLPEAITLLFKVGSYLVERGRNPEAEPLLEQALNLSIRQFGPDHPKHIPLLDKQAQLYWLQLRYELAESLLKRALALGERHLEPTHPQVTTVLGDLATVLRDQEKYRQAEPLYLRVLAIDEQQLGPDHPAVAETLDSLAVLYWNLGKDEQAEPLYLRALRIHEQQLGLEHPRTSTTLHNLATLYRNQGKYEQAEPLYLRALRIRERAELTHLSEATTLHALATLYRSQSKYAQAEALYQQALHIREQQLGPDHLKTALTLIDLATLYREQGKYAEAESFYQRALAINEQQRGAEHPETATILHLLADLYQRWGRMEQAESLYRRVLLIREQQLEPEHPAIVATLSDLASLSYELERHREAELFFQQALALCEQHLGPAHPKTAELHKQRSRLLASCNTTAQETQEKGQEASP